MPWWAQGCETTGKMVISYDNLIRRLWLHGAVFPYNGDCTNESSFETLLNEDGMPPIPHEHWIHRLGFQQQDPVTDFRSGGVLSLALMLHVAESCPKVFHRYVRPNGDASVLPFAITSINITDMLSKFLMLSKTVDRMDALLSQKPFWRMFAEPNAITACQELAMDMLADVVVELHLQRGAVTVFDFSAILAKTERRIQYDLLGAGPRSVAELYEVHTKVKLKHQQQLTLDTAVVESSGPPALSHHSQSPATAPRNEDVKDHVMLTASAFATSATQLTGSILSRFKGMGLAPESDHKEEDVNTSALNEPSSVVSTADDSFGQASPVLDQTSSSKDKDPALAPSIATEEEEWVQAGNEMQRCENKFSIECTEEGEFV